MKSKGISAAPYEVDLQVKLAFPLISPLMILIAIPFALRRQMSGSMALSFGVAMLIGFGYWVLSAFCISLGHNGALPLGLPPDPQQHLRIDRAIFLHSRSLARSRVSVTFSKTRCNRIKIHRPSSTCAGSAKWIFGPL